MIALVTVLYIMLILVIYKTLKIKPNPKNIAAMTVIGVVVIGAILVMWKFAAPSSSSLVVSRYTVELVPQVKGPITKIHAEPNVPLKKGKDLLFEIQSETYQHTVDQLTEALKAAEKNIEQLEAGSVAAEAAVKKAVATRKAAEAELKISQDMAKAQVGAISKLELQQLTQQFYATEAGVEQAEASALQASIATLGAESTAKSLQSQLANAQFNLDQCKVYAPSDGFVTHWTVREGTMAVPMPLAKMGTFVDTTSVVIVASFPQNVLANVQAGAPAELTFKTRPGEVFSAQVEMVVQASGEGQFSVTGDLPSAADLSSDGMFVVRFKLDDEEAANELAIGTAGTAVIYSDHGKPFHIISKVVVRMNALMYYLIPF